MVQKPKPETIVLKESCSINGVRLPAGEPILWPDGDFPFPHIVAERLPAEEAKLLPEEDAENAGSLKEVQE